MKPKSYFIWRSMMARCYNENADRYADYGARGITVCEKWRLFENFFADMGEKPDGLSLERKDNNGNYCPENVQWCDAKAQANNRRSNILLTYKGKTKTMQQWCDEIGLKIGTVWARINKYGYSVEKALTPGWRAR